METAAITKHILLVDDDPVTNLINTRIINMHTRARVESFTNAQEALDQCGQWVSLNPDEFPDIIFLDINMPVMDGWEFVVEFEKLPLKSREKCGLYLLTSSIDAEDIEKSRAFESIADFLSKPLTINTIKKILEKESTHING